MQGRWLNHGLSSEGQPASVAPKESASGVPDGRQRIFVVDDEELIASTLGMILRLKGFDCDCFTKPLDAVEAARGVAPDLLLSDIVMPVMSGIDLAIELRKLCPSCKVLLLSGQAGAQHLLEAARCQGHQFEVLLKPMHPTDLLKRVQMATEDSAPKR